MRLSLSGQISFLALLAAWAALLPARPALASHAARQLETEQVLTGPADGVMAMAFSPDGKRVAAACHDGTVWLWNVADGKPLHVFRGHESAVYSVSFSQDGRRLVTGGRDHTARVWDVDTGHEIAILEGHTRTVRAAFLPDGKVLTGGGDGTLRVWDVDDEKELWRSPPDECVTALAVTPDGTRAAYGSCDGMVRVWDLVHHQRLGRYGEGAIYEVDAVALTPDGKRVYRHIFNELLKAWEVDGGKPVDLPLWVRGRGSVALSADGSLLTDGFCVVERETGRQRYRTPQVWKETVRAIAFSPDGSHMALGGGGTGFDDNGTWKPGRENAIAVFTLADPKPAAPGPPSGVVSWEVIPADVRDAAGKPLGEGERNWAVPARNNIHWWVASAAAPAADLMCGQYEVLLHRKKGVVEQVLEDFKANYSDAVWDGEHFWVASRMGGITVLAPDGAVVAKLDASHGLPGAARAMLLHALGPGRVLAAGADDAGGWCAVIERAKGADGAAGGAPDFNVNVFFKESQLPREWRESVGNAVAPAPALTPVYFTEPPAANDGNDADGRREVWLVCGPVPRSPSPVLRIDAKTLDVRPYNLTPRDNESVRAHWAASLGDKGGLVWLDAQNFLLPLGDPVFRRTAGADYIDESARQTVASHLAHYWEPHALSREGQVYVAGNEWYRIAPKTLQVRHLGPGLRNSDGTPIGGQVIYLNSSLLGLSAFSPTDGCFYRISLDPAHPLPVRATLDAPPPLPEVPVGGAVDYFNGLVTFRCGLGDVSFHNGQLVTRPEFYATPHLAVRAKEREKGMTCEAVNELAGRITGEEGTEERQRIGFTYEQAGRLRAVNPRNTRPLDQRRLEALYRAWAAAPEGPERDKAAEPLMAEARALGERWSKEADDWLSGFQTVLTPRQWKMIRYEDPDEP